MVISCRTEYLGAGYKCHFQPTDRNSLGNPMLFEEAFIVPFNKNQINEYIDQHVLLHMPPWSATDYKQAFKQIPNLQDLVTNPFLLKLAMEVLPELLENGNNFTSMRITRIMLYDKFVAQWIYRSKIRLTEMATTPRSKSLLSLNSGFEQECIAYLKELAAAIYNNQDGRAAIDYLERRDKKTWKYNFFNERDIEQSLVREAIPMVRIGNQYRFIHRSVLEYGIALAIYDPSNHIENTEPLSPLNRRGSSSSLLSFESTKSMVEEVVPIEQELMDSPLGRKNFVTEPSVIQFLVERVRDRVFKTQLHAVVERSKTEKNARKAAANAITVLVKARVQFNRADLRGIKIPGADLSYGVFDSAKIEGADLRKVNLRNTWLRSANFSTSQMTGAQFGEFPSLTENSSVRCCVYSNDGKFLAVGLDSGAIGLYETTNWEKLRSIQAHQGEVTTFMYAVTGRHTPREGVLSLAFSSSGSWIASGSVDKTVRLWEVGTGKCIHNLQGHSEKVTRVACSPKGNAVASGSYDKTVRLWNVDTKRILILKGHGGFIEGVAYSPNGDHIASGGWDHTVRLWDTDTGVCTHIFDDHKDRIVCLAYSPKGDQIAAGDLDGVKLWDISTSTSTLSLQINGENYADCVQYSPKGDQIASGHSEAIRLWDVDNGVCTYTLQGHGKSVSSIVYSPKGDKIASGSYDKTVRLWGIDVGNSQSLKGHPQGHSSAIRSVAYLPSRGQVASGSIDGTVRIWDAIDGTCTTTLNGNGGAVVSIDCSPKGDRIASVNWDKTIRVLDIDSGKIIHILQGHKYEVNCVKYSPNGEQIASGGVDGVRLWDAKTGNFTYHLQGHTYAVTAIMYSPNGRLIASGSQDEAVRLWNSSTGQLICAFHGHSKRMSSVAFAPNAYQIASGSWDNTVRLWDIKTGKCSTILQGHSNWVTNVAYSAKGDQIASGSDDNTVRLWDVKNGQCLSQISCFNRSVVSVAWGSISGQEYLFTGSNDNAVCSWQIMKDGNRQDVVLNWSSTHEALAVQNTTFHDVKGLTPLDQKLLNQRGASVKP